MIITRFTDFRHHFATTTTLGPGGYEPWPVELKSEDLEIQCDDAAPFKTFPGSCYVAAGDSDLDVGGTFNWYLSQRTDEPDVQALSLVSPAGYSGRVTFDVTPWYPARMLKRFPPNEGDPHADPPIPPDPGGFKPGNSDHLRELYKHCHLYVSRQSDKAWSFIDISKRLWGIDP